MWTQTEPHYLVFPACLSNFRPVQSISISDYLKKLWTQENQEFLKNRTGTEGWWKNIETEWNKLATESVIETRYLGFSSFNRKSLLEKVPQEYIVSRWSVRGKNLWQVPISIRDGTFSRRDPTVNRFKHCAVSQFSWFTHILSLSPDSEDQSFHWKNCLTTSLKAGLDNKIRRREARKFSKTQYNLSRLCLVLKKRERGRVGKVNGQFTAEQTVGHLERVSPTNCGTHVSLTTWDSKNRGEEERKVTP